MGNRARAGLSGDPYGDRHDLYGEHPLSIWWRVTSFPTKTARTLRRRPERSDVAYEDVADLGAQRVTCMRGS